MNSTDPTDDIGTLLDSADDLLGRAGCALDHVLVVSVAPRPTIAFWHPSDPARVVPLPETCGTSGAELLRAAAPVAENFLRSLPDEARATVAEALVDGGRLELLISPADSGAVLRLTQGGHAVDGTSVVWHSTTASA